MTRYFQLSFRPFFHDPALSEQLAMGIDAQWLANLAVTNDRVWNSIGEYDIHDRLPRMTAPTLVMHGTSSVIAMGGAEAIAARLPRAQLMVLKDVGHFPYVEAPDTFAAAVRAFVTRRGATATVTRPGRPDRPR